MEMFCWSFVSFFFSVIVSKYFGDVLLYLKIVNSSRFIIISNQIYG